MSEDTEASIPYPKALLATGWAQAQRKKGLKLSAKRGWERIPRPRSCQRSTLDRRRSFKSSPETTRG